MAIEMDGQADDKPFNSFGGNEICKEFPVKFVGLAMAGTVGGCDPEGSIGNRDTDSLGPKINAREPLIFFDIAYHLQSPARRCLEMLLPATGLQLLNHLPNGLFIVFICYERCVWCVDDDRILQPERDDQVILTCMDDGP